MSGWYTGQGGMEVDWIFTILKFDIFLGFGGMSIKEGVEATSVGSSFGGENEIATCDDIERDLCTSFLLAKYLLLRIVKSKSSRPNIRSAAQQFSTPLFPS